MKNNRNNRKKPVEGKDYRVDRSEPGVTRVVNLRHPDNKKEESNPTPLVRNIRIGHDEDGMKVVKDSIQPASGKTKDILSMIRARQEGVGDYKPSTDSSKLREFLKSLDKDTCEQDYSDTPIYKLGHEDGYSDGYDKGYGDAYYELFKVLKAIETIIEPHVEKPC